MRVRRPTVGKIFLPAGSIRLPAEERRDIKLVFLAAVMHRHLPTMLVEPLGRRTLGIFRDRLWPLFGPHVLSHVLAHVLARSNRPTERPPGRARGRGGPGGLRRHGGPRLRRRGRALVVVTAPAETDGREPLQERRAALLWMLLLEFAAAGAN